MSSFSFLCFWPAPFPSRVAHFLFQAAALPSSPLGPKPSAPFSSAPAQAGFPFCASRVPVLQAVGPALLAQPHAQPLPQNRAFLSAADQLGPLVRHLLPLAVAGSDSVPHRCRSPKLLRPPRCHGAQVFQPHK